MAENELILKTLNQILARISNIEETIGIEESGSGSSQEAPRSIRAYDAFVLEHVDPFEAKGNELGGKAADLGRIVKEAFMEQRKFLYRAAECKAPAKLPQDAMPLMKPIGALLQEVGKLRMRDEFEFHCRATEELMSSLNWLLITPAPRDYVENFIGASDMWANKIRMEHRGKNATQIGFCDALKNILKELMVYIKEYHTTGVAWNKKSEIEFADWKGVDGGEGGVTKSTPTPTETKPKETTTTSTATSTTSPPTPPPAPQQNGGGKAALFGELSKGLNITSGLKKVTKDMQTWREDFKGHDGDAPVPKKDVSSKKTTSKFTSAPAVKHDPVHTYNQAQWKWEVSYHTEGIVNVDVKSNKESVYIYKCGNAVIDIRGTGKSILIDGCNKTQILCDEMISTVEFVNCKNVKFQVRETVPTVTIDKTDSIVTYLSWKSMGTNFLTSKSSDMNVSYPSAEGSDEMEEKPIPEQFSSTLKRKENGSVECLETEVSDLYA